MKWRSRSAAILAVLLVIMAAIAVSTPSAAEAAGNLVPPHADSGLDTNSDNLYNYLRIDVSIDVNQSGRFTAQIRLNDSLDFAEITNSSIAAYLDTGRRSLQVLLSGPDIYNAGVDGPYYAHITLKSDSGAVLSTGTHVTAAYPFADFQPYSIRYVQPTLERTPDNDTDGLYDWLTVSLTLDVQTEDDYVIASRLVDRGYELAINWRTAIRLAPGAADVTQFFIGYPIRLAGVSGSFLVTNDLYDGRGSLVDFLLYETKAYSNSDFETPPAVLDPPHSDEGIDADGDGLYSALHVNVGLSVQSTATVAIAGELQSSDGSTPILTSEKRTTLAPGTATVLLAFSGASIYSSGLDGPYQVHLRVADVEGRVLSEGDHATAPYAYTSFESAVLRLQAPHEDYGIDVDADGKYEALSLQVYLEVEIPGAFLFDAVLRDPLNSIAIASATREYSLTAGPQTASLEFPGFAIRSVGIDGPYRVSIVVRDPSDGTLLDEGAHRTKGYLADDFEGEATGAILGIVQEETLDTEPSPDGLVNILRIHVGLSPGSSGRYRLEGILSSADLSITSSATIAVLPPGLSDVSLSFSGWEVSASQRDGPYGLLVTLWNLQDASEPLANATLVTSSYSVVQFQAAPTATISGRILSSYQSRPLSDGEVMAVNYSNAFFQRARSDQEGKYTLPLFAANYRLIIDHPAGQARAAQLEIAGQMSVEFTLYPPIPNVLETDVVWQGWQNATVSVQYLLRQDSSALRIRLDWDQGNRDGFVDPTEDAIWPALPLAHARSALEAGSTDDYLLINGGSYVAQGEIVLEDGVVGSVMSDATPVLRVSRSFALDPSIGSPPRVGLRVTVASDTADWNRIDLLHIPAGYRFSMYEADESVYFYARRLPYVIDPQVDPEDPNSAITHIVDIFLLRKFYYTAPTPSPPSNLQATAEGGRVTLSWSAPIANTDGSRITNLAGFHVYRSDSSGSGYARVNHLLVTTTSFTDSTVPPGTHFYVVTAVNTDSLESGFSNEVSVNLSSALAGGPVPAAQWSPPLVVLLVVVSALALALALVPIFRNVRSNGRRKRSALKTDARIALSEDERRALP